MPACVNGSAIRSVFKREMHSFSDSAFHLGCLSVEIEKEERGGSIGAGFDEDKEGIFELGRLRVNSPPNITLG